MDFWLMAEQMVLEAMSATTRLHSTAVSQPPVSPSLGEIPVEAPVARVRELAQCMWASAGRQYGMAQDYWLSAERHVLAMLRASTTPASREPAAWAAELKTLSPADYLERIRVLAFYYWEAAGRGYGEAMDYWLQAERDMLNAMAAATERGTPLGTAAVITPAAGVPADTTASPIATPAMPGGDAAEPVRAAAVVPSQDDAGGEPVAAPTASASADALPAALVEAKRVAKTPAPTKAKRSTRATPAKPATSPTRH